MQRSTLFRRSARALSLASRMGSLISPTDGAFARRAWVRTHAGALTPPSASMRRSLYQLSARTARLVSLEQLPRYCYLLELWVMQCSLGSLQDLAVLPPLWKRASPPHVKLTKRNDQDTQAIVRLLEGGKQQRHSAVSNFGESNADIPCHDPEKDDRDWDPQLQQCQFLCSKYIGRACFEQLLAWLPRRRFCWLIVTDSGNSHIRGMPARCFWGCLGKSWFAFKNLPPLILYSFPFELWCVRADKSYSWIAFL